MEELANLIIEKNSKVELNKILINFFNYYNQLVIYMNIDDLCLLEINELAEDFVYLRNHKQINADLILYSHEILAEDAINALANMKVDYLYCGEINNIALAVLMNIVRMTQYKPIVKIDLSHEKWFDELLFAAYYNNRLFLMNGDKCSDIELLKAVLLYNKIDNKDIVNYTTIKYLICNNKIVNNFITDGVYFINENKIYNYKHVLLGDINTNNLSTILKSIQNDSIVECNKECNLKPLCHNFKTNMIDIATLNNCELLKTICNIVLLDEDINHG